MIEYTGGNEVFFLNLFIQKTLLTMKMTSLIAASAGRPSPDSFLDQHIDVIRGRNDLEGHRRG